MPFTEGQCVRMLCTCRGAIPETNGNVYPPGVLGTILAPKYEGEVTVQVNDIVIHFSEDLAPKMMQSLAPTTKLTATLIPYSSIVGAGVMLLDGSGACVGQLAICGVGAGRAEQEAMRDRIVAAINAGQPERLTKHKNGRTYDVVTDEALFQVGTWSDGGGPRKDRRVSAGDKVTVYRNPEGMHFVRFPDEMVSPRFEDVQS